MPLSRDELFRLAYDAGFRGDNLRMAVAVALAESGGNPNAYNAELAAGTAPGAGSRGLWQIYGTAHPQYNSSIAFDPIVNARGAYEIYKQAGNRFTPWSTFNNGMAVSIYNSLKTPSNLGGSKKGLQPNMGGIGSGTQKQDGALGEIASGQFAKNAIDKIFGGFDFVSFGFFMFGVILIAIGLFILFRQPVANAALSAFEVAAASKGVPLKLQKLGE